MPDFYRIVVIDDMRVPADGTGDIKVELYKTPEDGLAALRKYHEAGEKVGELWLDHDMGLDYLTGDDITIWPVVNWLEQLGHDGTPLDVDEILVHTSNYMRGVQMVNALKRYYRVHTSELPLKSRSK